MLKFTGSGLWLSRAKPLHNRENASWYLPPPQGSGIEMSDVHYLHAIIGRERVRKENVFFLLIYCLFVVLTGQLEIKLPTSKASDPNIQLFEKHFYGSNQLHDAVNHLTFFCKNLMIWFNNMELKMPLVSFLVSVSLRLSYNFLPMH